MTLLENVLFLPNTDNLKANKWESSFSLPSYTNNTILGNICNDTLRQTIARIYGMVLSNDSSGILYHTIGLNGAMYRNYNHSLYFISQLNLLKPELIIISLGTNEAQSLKLTKEEFYTEIDTLVKAIRLNTGADILLTLPQDSYRRKWHYNLKVKDIAETLKLYAGNNSLAYWDYYSIAGVISHVINGGKVD